MPTQAERRRAPRYSFIAMAEIVDEYEQARTASRVSDLSRHGCYVEMTNPFPQGHNVLIEICTETESLETHATVAYLEPNQGMGLTFSEMPPHVEMVLNKWLARANGRKPH